MVSWFRSSVHVGLYGCLIKDFSGLMPSNIFSIWQRFVSSSIESCGS